MPFDLKKSVSVPPTPVSITAVTLSTTIAQLPCPTSKITSLEDVIFWSNLGSGFKFLQKQVVTTFGTGIHLSKEALVRSDT